MSGSCYVEGSGNESCSSYGSEDNPRLVAWNLREEGKYRATGAGLIVQTLQVSCYTIVTQEPLHATRGRCTFRVRWEQSRGQPPTAL